MGRMDREQGAGMCAAKEVSKNAKDNHCISSHDGRAVVPDL